MVRIRPGRSWRLNPGYLQSLRGLTAPHARRFDASAILDVVGIEIDGVDIAAGVGEAPVVLAVAELASALVRLADGRPAAQATVGPGPTEVVLEARGSDVLLSLVRLVRPSRVLAGGLLVDGARLRAAALLAVRGLIADLLDVSPAVGAAPVVKQLALAAQRLSRRTTRTAAPWPPAASSSDGVRSLVLRSGRGPVRCEVQLPLEAALRLAAPVEGAPLASLLARGSLALRVAGAPALSLEAPLFLALRDAVRDAAALVQAWEAGERGLTLSLLGVEARFDLTRDEVRAAGWTRPAKAAPLDVALALAGAARTFALRARALAGGSTALLEPLEDLSREARELLRHCRDVATGALRRAPEAVAAPPLRRPPPREQRPLHVGGRVRRLVFREAWRARLPGAPAALWLCGPDGTAPAQPPGALVVVASGEAVGLDLQSGRPLWSHSCASARSAVRAATGGDLFVLGPEALSRLDPLTGQVRWHRKLRSGEGPEAALQALPSGVLVAASGALTLVDDGGRIAWRARLEESPRSVLAHESALLFALPGGMLGALDLSTGRALWRRRVGARASAPVLALGRVVIAAEKGSGAPPRLFAFETQSGQPAWQIELPAAPAPPTLVAAGDALAFVGGRGACVHRASDGARRFERELPWGPLGQLAAVDEPDEARSPGPRKLQGPLLIAAGPGGALALIDAGGEIAWHLAADGAALPAAPLLVRGVAISAGAGLRLCDALEGFQVAQLGGPREPTRWAAAPDLTFALCDQAEVSVHRLATHLSVV